MKSSLFTTDERSIYNPSEETFSSLSTKERRMEKERKRKEMDEKRDRATRKWQLTCRIFGTTYRSLSGREEYRARKFFSLPLHSTHFSILCVRSVLLGPRSGLRVVNLPPLGRIPLINEEHCARPKFCERHTRASTTGDGRKTRDRAVGGEEKKKRQKEKRGWKSRRKPFDLSLVSPIVYLRFLIFAARISFHLGTNELLSSRYTEDTV